MDCLVYAITLWLLIAKALGKDKIAQPFEIKAAAEFVRSGSYHTHCDLNRSEHARMERDLRVAVKEVDDKHNELAREVSSVTTLAETTDAKLTLMDNKLDNILRALPKQPIHR